VEGWGGDGQRQIDLPSLAIDRSQCSPLARIGHKAVGDCWAIARHSRITSRSTGPGQIEPCAHGAGCGEQFIHSDRQCSDSRDPPMVVEWEDISYCRTAFPLQTMPYSYGWLPIIERASRIAAKLERVGPQS
jgi:hypothetical protein